MKGEPGLLTLPSSAFFQLKEKYYALVSGADTFLLYEPVVVKAVCRNEKILLSLNPGSLLTYGENDELLEYSCIITEYFWFKGSRISWKIKEVPYTMLDIVKRAGFSIGEGVAEIVSMNGIESFLSLKRGWHPSAIALEEGIKCEGFEGKGLEIASCGSKGGVIINGKEALVGLKEEFWRLLPLVAFMSSQ
ncbi:hypothetical protein IPA_00210 [Ignicoccus pacificus DSM 13166]|uniref:Uncharacterized protein n=1 Tax=Ignicoccus pacificus DSM 13166 TaxID=940294 RepID=A0A977PKZ6_9CREN|nr:hypothetical protein IPA_00210 [Ignicoccus pacificus DSM 13166]